MAGAQQVAADMLPQIAVDRLVGGGQIVGDRNARQFDDAAFDRVHQAEIGHDPGEQGSLSVPRTMKEERRRRQIVDGAQPDLTLQRLDAADPQPSRLVVLSCLWLGLAVEPLLFGERPLPVAVMGLVIEHDDILEREQFAAGTAEHLPVRLARFDRLRVVAGQKRAPDPRQRNSLTMLEGVVVGNDDCGLSHIAQHIAGQQLARPVIALGVLGVEYLKPILDRDAGSDDQEGAREAVGARHAHGIERLPGNDHRHDRGLARAGRHFQSEAEQLGVGLGICRLDRAPEVGILPPAAGDLGQPDQRLDGLDLAEEWPLAGEIWTAPMLK
jgi:hypothetical protein